MPIMSIVDELLANNARYAAAFDRGDLPPRPARSLAIVACMDARLDVYAALGLRPGDAHVIRNAGGVVSQDVVRSLTISQRLLGTREIVLVQHTECGMLTFDEDEVSRQIEADVGLRPPFALGAFADLATSVRRSLAALTASPFIPHKQGLHGFIYDVAAGRLAEVRP
jgi:carbonic anhydrase